MKYFDILFCSVTNRERLKGWEPVRSALLSVPHEHVLVIVHLIIGMKITFVDKKKTFKKKA